MSRKKALESVLGAPSSSAEGLSAEEKFLRDYVSGEWWKHENASNIPITYSHHDAHNSLCEDDIKDDDEADRFEAQYNFRFGEIQQTTL